MKIATIIQTRMASTRLPGKVLMTVVGKTFLELLLERVKHSKHITETVIATTTNHKDDVLYDFCKQKGIKVFRGSENDVLDRYYQTAKEFKVDVVVRITSDCPLIDMYVVDKVIEEFLKEKYDYVSNIAPPTYPDGLDVYIFSFKALETAWKETKFTETPQNQSEKDDNYRREHVTPYFWQNPTEFKIGNISQKEDMSQKHRWTLDYEEDYQFLKRVFEELYKEGQIFYMEDVLDLVKRKPEVYALNVNRVQNNSFK
jgi:spore coat polysaccharide biosynthesis protein SpsF